MRSGTLRLAVGLAVLFVVLSLLPMVAGQAPPVEDRQRDTTLTEGDPRTPSGEVISDLWVKVIWVSSAIFLLVTVLLVYALVRWRHRRGEVREVPQVHGNSKLEIAWTIGPALIMVWFLVISYNGLFAIDDPEGLNPDVYVDVTGHAFFWEYSYPDGSASTGGQSVLRLQEGMWVQLNVTSADVHHAFKIPGLDVMIDAMPGRVNEVFLYTGDDAGVYFVQCMRFCGAGHGQMWSTVEIFAQGEQPLPYGDAPREPAQAGDEGQQEQPDNGTQDEQDGNATDDGNGTDDGNATDDGNGTADVDRVIEVDLFDYFFDPAPIEVEEGETVEVRVVNTGPSPHDLNIGMYDFESNQGERVCDDPDDEETCWMTEQSMPAGNEDSFVLSAPDEAVAYSLWCDVPGHVQQGMISYLSIGGAEPEDEAPEPRLPGPGAALVLVVLGGLLAITRRRFQ